MYRDQLLSQIMPWTFLGGTMLKPTQLTALSLGVHNVVVIWINGKQRFYRTEFAVAMSLLVTARHAMDTMDRLVCARCVMHATRGATIALFNIQAHRVQSAVK
jgi:hypothetical protein